MTDEIKRNEIWLADLGTRDGSEQGGIRPVLILQNDVGNRFSPTVIIAAITDVKKMHIPTHVFIDSGKYGLFKDSTILLEQVQTIDKKKLIKRMGSLSETDRKKVGKALSISLALGYRDNNGSL
jgi:mRNA interferase MazF